MTKEEEDRHEDKGDNGGDDTHLIKEQEDRHAGEDGGDDDDTHLIKERRKAGTQVKMVVMMMTLT